MKHNPFYDSKEWRKLRKEVLNKHKSECQVCKRKGKYTRATHVHHVMRLEDYPQYALDEYAMRDGQRIKNLEPVCKDCHETVCHPERLRHWKEPLTKERW